MLVGLAAIATSHCSLAVTRRTTKFILSLGMIWLWRDRADAENVALHACATFWYVLPSLPMFLLIPALLRRGVGFWPSLIAGCAVTISLYLLMTWAAPRFGIRL
ncbi:DUF3147 family protein [Sphingomonas sp. PB4P5]|uniref:DUF3147 family protein n=1 Tax=Parasphingomonas puruogangriensis TaxID=3096155 RepID=UPI003FA76A3E